MHDLKQPGYGARILSRSRVLQNVHDRVVYVQLLFIVNEEWLYLCDDVITQNVIWSDESSCTIQQVPLTLSGRN
jgi:hypothetical protein